MHLLQVIFAVICNKIYVIVHTYNDQAVASSSKIKKAKWPSEARIGLVIASGVWVRYSQQS
jgi:hypothetical protein